VIIDMGTGDGRAVLVRAANEPRALVIGIDANAAAMAEASRRAVRPVRQGGLPNAVFAVAAAEAPPSELTGLADDVSVTLPWGSLLDGVLGRMPMVAAGLAGLLTPAGRIEALVSTAARDGRDLPRFDDRLAAVIGEAWSPFGMDVHELRPATRAELVAMPSTWARRLRLGAPDAGGREAWRLTLRRAPR
jgi:16S rRNA (adenine(1408)-N(1))-methyltransferase